MNIYIKSFNRPYYLDRCITSIFNNCEGNFQIFVLDDGTPDVYLNKLYSKFPSVIFKASPFQKRKAEIINTNLYNCKTEISKLGIPAQFWLESVLSDEKEAFMLLEDDMWFIEKTDLDKVEKLFSKTSLQILKLASYGNENINYGKRISLSTEIDAIVPKLLVTNPKMFKYFANNTFKVRSILNKLLGINNDKLLLRYYTTYMVAGAVYTKKYYQFLWNDFNGKVNELKQLEKAVFYYKTHQHKNLYSVYNKDRITTSFSSSATNMFTHINFNVFQYNLILNEAWLNEILNPMENYPNDFSEEIIESILNKANYEDTGFLEWRKWKNMFESRYKKVGHKL